MRAVLMTAVGGSEVLELADVPEPEVTGEHDVLVRLRAAGVNPVDYKLRSSGTIGGSLPAVLGWDGAGIVERVGAAGGVGHVSVQIARLAGSRAATTVSPGPKTALASSLGAELCNRSLRVSFTWTPAPSVFGCPAHRERQRKILEQAGRHFDHAELRVEVGATFPIERAADAHGALEAGDVVGKAVLTFD